MKRIFRFASLLMSAVMLLSCSGNLDDGDNTGGGSTGGDNNGSGTTGGGSTTPKTLTLSSDKNLIQTFDGDYATLTVMLDGEKITEGVTFFDGQNKVVEIPDFKFSTSKVGEYTFWANYGTLNTEKVTIKAIDVKIPETPEDPEPGSTDFVSRVLLTEFTTVGCAACPAMKEILHDLAADELGGSVVFTECHSGLVNKVADPCYLHDKAFEEFCMTNSFPDVKLGLDKTLTSRDALKPIIRDILAAQEDLAPGIAVNSTLKDDKIVAKVTVKAQVSSSYRVGAFLLEDGIEAKQTNATASWMNTHDNVIRYVDAAYKTSYYGYPVAEIKAGETADIMFSWILDDIWEYGSEKGEINGGIKWPERNNDKLHVAFFVSMSDGEGGYVIVNALDCRNLNGETPFEYR